MGFIRIYWTSHKIVISGTFNFAKDWAQNNGTRLYPVLITFSNRAIRIPIRQAFFELWLFILCAFLKN